MTSVPPSILAAHKRKLQAIAKELGVQQLNDWYEVPRSKLTAIAPWIRRHYGNVYGALKQLFPDHPWKQSRFTPGTSSQTLKERLEEVGKQLGVKTLDDWYQVSRSEVRKQIPFIRSRFGNLQSALEEFYPEHKWDPSKFHRPHKYWINVDNQRKKLNELAEELGVKSMDDWYNVSRLTVRNKAPFVQEYYGGVFNALKSIFPEHNWIESRFYYWGQLDRQRQKLEEIGKVLGVTKLDDWYKVSRKEVHSRAPWINTYYGDVFTALKNIYPHHNWNELACTRILWTDAETNMKQLMQRLVEKYGIQTQQDWHQLSQKEWKLVNKFAAAKFRSMRQMIRNLFPSMTTPHPFTGPEVSLQLMLKTLTTVTPQHRIAGHSIDLYLPEWKIAIEYQGFHHYQQTYRGSFQDQWRRDIRKKQDLSQLGISLVQIPYWWDQTLTTLKNTLQQQVPRLNSYEIFHKLHCLS